MTTHAPAPTDPTGPRDDGAAARPDHAARRPRDAEAGPDHAEPDPGPRVAARLRRVLAVVGRGLLLAVGVGILGGLAARLWMRLFSVVLGHETSFSWPGTLGIVMVFTIGVVPGALAVVATTRRLRMVPLAAGVLFLWFATVTTAVQENLPTSPTAAQVAGLVLVGLAFLLTPPAQMWVLVRAVDRARR